MWAGPMRVREILSWASYRTASLVIGCAQFVVVAVLLCVIPCLSFVLIAQIYGWAVSDHWHPVPISEFLQIIKFDDASINSWSETIGSFWLGLPTTGALFLLAAVLFWMNAMLNRLNRYRRQGLLQAGQRNLIGAIEKALNGDRK